MKIAKLILSVSVIAILFSSCLGDSNNTMGFTNQFGYVQSSPTGVKYAGTANNILVTGNELNKCNPGDFVWLTFNVDLSQGANKEGIYTSQDLVATKITKYIKSQDVIAQAPDDANTIPVNDFQIRVSNPYQDFLRDNWSFGVTHKKKEGEVLQAYFYYDANNQLDKSGNPLGENRIILDVRFKKITEGVGNESSENELLITSLQRLRTLYKPKYVTENNNSKLTGVLIQFRYKKLVDTDIKDETIGSSVSNAQNSYGMYFKNPGAN